MQRIQESELIINKRGAIYHLDLRPEELATTIITVGDPDRVEAVSRHFDSIEFTCQHREFVTHTGYIGSKRLSVVSTGIGPDNIDIVMNELDALANIDFNERKIKSSLTSLNIIRIGTSGSIHPDIHIEDIVLSRYAIGTDIGGEYYGINEKPNGIFPPWSYLTKAYDFDLSNMQANCKEGVIITCPGFYAAQGRSLRLNAKYQLSIDQFQEIRIDGLPITNMDMETAAIYLLAEKMGHKAVSFNIILAQRILNLFKPDYSELMKKSIKDILFWITQL